MHEYRVYFMQGRSIIAAEVIEAPDHDKAAQAAVRGIAGYPWARTLVPTGFEVWHGRTFHQSAALA